MNAKCLVSECFTCLGSEQRVSAGERITVKGHGGEAKKRGGDGFGSGRR